MNETTRSSPDEPQQVAALGKADDPPGLERSLSLTDAVVAIAMTLLVLPLVDLVDTDDPFTLVGLWSDHSALFVSFAVSFVVIWIFWNAHDSIHRRLLTAGTSHVAGLSQVNVCWLLLIALLPFSTVLVGRKVTTGTAPVYLATMLLLSASTHALDVLVRRAVGGVAQRARLTTALIALCTLVSLVQAHLGMYLLLLLLVCGRVERRLVAHTRARRAETPPPLIHEQ